MQSLQLKTRQRQRGVRLRAACLAMLVLGVCQSCSAPKWVTVRETPHNPLSDTLSLISDQGPQHTPRTVQLLRRYDLSELAEQDVSATTDRLEEVHQNDRNREALYAASEVCYVQAKRLETSQPEEAVKLFNASVLFAFRYLFDEQCTIRRNPYDPQFRGACDLYNAALEGSLRILQAKHDLRPGSIIEVEAAGHKHQLSIVLNSKGWHAEDFDRFEFVSDYEVAGLTNHYRNFGLGVPLIALRKPHGDEEPAEQFYPSALTFPVTAFVRLAKDQAGETQAVLELQDPLSQMDVAVGEHRVPLETDLSTPLAYFLSLPEFDDDRLSGLGFLMPEKAEEVAGLYMLEPFRDDRIPVVMVHGLLSSPATWMEMFNDLRSDPRLRANYQFWFYLYPNGQPFWQSAARLRRDLNHMRRQLDPSKQHAALDQMVLVGHSMGGLVSRLQTVHSNNDFWATLSDQPFRELQADDEAKTALANMFFFEPSPSVARVITLGTPHRGSNFANTATRWLSRAVITMPNRLIRGKERILADNPTYFREDAPLDVQNSVDSLAPDTVLLSTLLDAERAPWIEHHNIVGDIPRDDWFGYVTDKFGNNGDGVVALSSSRVDHVASELIVPADHSSVHRHPQSVLEVRRILLEQLAELRAYPPAGRLSARPASESADQRSRR